jgi:thiol-disulfide isomerase/thioredoxin
MSDAPVHAPEFPENLAWLNSPTPLRIADELRGQVLLLDFWTYCCINCMHMLSELSQLEEEFANEPFTVIGVHSPKFDNERDPENVRHALKRLHVEHPVVVDADREVWGAYTVSAWPTTILVDTKGYVREEMRGEIPIGELREKIRGLLEEGRKVGLATTRPRTSEASSPTDDQILLYPGKVTADESRLFISDSGHHRILVCDHDGRIEKIIGGNEPGHDDGRYDTARFNDPQGMASDGGTLWVADRGNHLLRQIHLDLFWVKTIAGNGKLGQSRTAADPTRPLAQALRSPWDVQLVGQHLLVAMAGSHQIWLYDIEKDEIGAWAGSGVEDHIDGPMQEAAFAQPSGLSQVGPWVMIADSEVSSIRAIDLNQGEAQTISGGGLFDFGDRDGGPEEMALQHPMDLAVLGQDLYVADTYNHKIKVVNLPTMECRTLVGDGKPGLLNEPSGICVVGNHLLVADTNLHRVIRVDPKDGSVEALQLREQD